jgi:hypothetical protein
MSAPQILFLGDPAGLTLDVGDLMVIATTDPPTPGAAIGLRYDGTQASLTFDPAVLGSPPVLYARRAYPTPAADIVPGAMVRGAPALAAGSAQPVRAPVQVGTPVVNHPTLHSG